jgi:hypothetical protein
VALWNTFPNCKRTIERIIIDDDHAAFCWPATLGNEQQAIELRGTIVADFDGQGRRTPLSLYYERFLFSGAPPVLVGGATGRRRP